MTKGRRTKEQKNMKGETKTKMQNIKKDNTFRFRDFPVYRDARDLRKLIREVHFPQNESFVLRQQLWRAMDSVILNIAEGADRYSDKDFSHFLNMAVASANEVAACIDCALDSDYIDVKNTANIWTSWEVSLGS